MPTNPEATRILEDIAYATVATVNEDGTPWNTPVYCAYDDGWNIYWSSHPESVHSRNIARTKRAFIVIYNSKAKTGEGTGVYMEVSVEVLEQTDDIAAALTLLSERRGKPFADANKFYGSGPQRLYKATPHTIWINDADQDEDGDFIRDFRIQVV